MQIDVLHQASELLAALLLGNGAGLLYDLMRLPRGQSGGVRAFLSDLLFCVICGTGFFLLAMSMGEGRLGLGALAASWLGFLGWQRCVGPTLRPYMGRTFQILDNSTRKLKKSLKKFAFFRK